MEAVGIEQEASRLGCTEGFRFMEQLHDAGPDGHRDSHDDALAHAVDGVLLPVVGCIELKKRFIQSYTLIRKYWQLGNKLVDKARNAWRRKS